ncbi:MAG: hypothetical protein GY777_14235 [Candidatus Brocadiaceae bacterium]|nr:hypothetical protein [Candidatus Brocadiaceae bacterium]
MRIVNDKIGTVSDKWFFFTIVCLAVDYVRPQDILPIGFMRPGLIAILILVYFIISNNGLSLSMSKQTKLIWCFTILLGVYVPFARNNHHAFVTTKSMLLYMPLILSTIVCVNSIERLRKIVFIYIAIMMYVCLYGILHGGRGSGNYFLDENDISLFANIWIPFCFFLFLQERGMGKKVFYAAGMLIGLVSVVLSFSRGGFVGLVCVVVVMWFFSTRKMLSLLIICMLGIGVYVYSGEKYLAEMSTVTDTEESTANERLMSWRAGWDMFLAHPLGVGGFNFPIHFQDYQSEGFKKEMWGRQAHSLWFTLIPEVGIFGIMIYFILIYYNLKDLFLLKKIKAGNDPNMRFLHSLSLAFLASLAGFFASASFISVLYYAHYWYMTALIVVVVRVSKNYTKSMST